MFISGEAIGVCISFQGTKEALVEDRRFCTEMYVNEMHAQMLTETQIILSNMKSYENDISGHKWF